MVIHIRKWGNSAAVRLPSSVLTAADLKLDQAVDVRQEGDRIIISPIKAPVYDLDAMIDEMKPSTFHEDADFGKPVGKETW